MGPTVLPKQAPEAGNYRYYCHYEDYNRRLDEWVDSAAIAPRDKDTVYREVENQASNRRMSRQEAQAASVFENDEHAGLDEESIREHEEATRVKNIQRVELGKYDMATWYYSPLPEEYRYCEKLYFCEWDLRFFRNKKSLRRHLSKFSATQQHPPGDEIYRAGNMAVFEVDGCGENKIYCQNLSFLAKLFLDHKTLYYDVDPFLFYIICVCDDRGVHIAGYYSKEKHSQDDYNLACILTLPCYQKKGIGKFMIAFSYALSKREGKAGTPERPLSDMGYIAYCSYWKKHLLDILVDRQGEISIKELSDMTMFKTDDIVITLQRLHLIRYWKGDHIIAISDEVVKEVNDMRAKGERNPNLPIDDSKLQWQPKTYPRTWS